MSQKESLLMEDYNLSHITKVDYSSQVLGVFVLSGVLTKEETARFINIAESLKFTPAPLDQGIDPSRRNNERVIWEGDQEMLDILWGRIKDHVPKILAIGATAWSPLGFHPKLRFYRYALGQTFAKHYDGSTYVSSEEMSLLTFIVYLNNDFTGGHTTFFPKGKEPLKIDPQAGSALLFPHGEHEYSPLHEGSLVTQGTKYVLRGDIMYRKVS